MVSSCNCRLAPELSHKRASKPPHESGPTTSLAPRPSPALAEGASASTSENQDPLCALVARKSCGACRQRQLHPAAFIMPWQADVTKGHLGCHPHHASWGCCEWRGPGQTSLAGARVRPDGSVTHAASYRPGPCPGSLGTSPLGLTHIPHTHLPPRARRPRARAPGRRERERAREAAGWRVPGVHLTTPTLIEVYLTLPYLNFPLPSGLETSRRVKP